MTAKSACIYLVASSFGVMLLAVIVFMTGRYWGFPLDYMESEDIELTQLFMPPLSAILGSAFYYLANSSSYREAKMGAFLSALAILCPIIFVSVFLVATVSFHQSNAPESASYFSFDQYRGWIAISLSLITCASTGMFALLSREASAFRGEFSQ